MRKKIIAGNWKMNIKPSETAELVKAVAEATKSFAGVDIVFCTPAIDIPAAVQAAADVLTLCLAVPLSRKVLKEVKAKAIEAGQL